jgi:hypothetical protein
MSADGLLRWYPEPYRSERGPEILGVLMDAGGPTGRERRALILGGLRMRAGADSRRTTWQSWRAALRTAALMLLILTICDTLENLVQADTDFDRVDAVRIVLGLIAIAAILRHYFSVAVVTVAVLLATEGIVRLGSHPGLGHSPWLVILFLIPLAGHGPVRVPRSLHYLAAWTLVPAGLMFLQALLDQTSYANASRATWWFLLAAAVLWSVVDERFALTVGLVLLYNAAFLITGVADQVMDGYVASWMAGAISIELIMPIIGVTAGTIVARHRARL